MELLGACLEKNVPLRDDKKMCDKTGVIIGGPQGVNSQGNYNMV